MRLSNRVRIIVLLIAGSMLVGCQSWGPLPGETARPVVESPAAVILPTTGTPESSPAAESGEAPPAKLTNFTLQPITAQNVRDIVPVAVLEDGSYFIYSSVLSADGKWLAGSNARTVEVFETASGERKAVFPVTGAAYLALSSDGSRLAAWYARPWSKDEIVLWGEKSGGTDPRVDEKTLTVWNVNTQEVIFTKNAAEVCGKYLTNQMFQFLEDGTLALANVDFDAHSQSICRISAKDGSMLGRMDIPPQRGYIRGLALSSDGQIAAAAFSSSDRDYVNPTLVILQFPDGKVLFEKGMKEMPEVAFAPYSHILIVSSMETYRIQRMTPDGALISSIPLPVELGKNISLKVNNHFMIVESEQDEVVVFGLESGKEVQRIPLTPPRVPFLDARLDAGYKNISSALAAGADRLLIVQRYQGEYGDTLRRVFDLQQNGKELIRLATPPTISQVSDLSPDGDLIAMGGLWNGDVRIWSTRNGQVIQVLHGHKDVVNQAVFSPDGSKLASVSADGSVRLWDARNWEEMLTFNGHQGWALRAAFSPDGTKLLTSATDNTLRLWDTVTGLEIQQFEHPLPDGVVERLWFTSDRTILFTFVPDPGKQCVDCRARSFLLDIAANTFTELPWDWLSVYASPGGEWLLRYGAYPHYRLSIGRMMDGGFQPENEIALTSTNNSDKIGLSPDGKWMYTLNLNGINVFDRRSGEQVDLTANYLCSSCSQHGTMDVDPKGLFLVDYDPGALILWGVPEG